MLTTRESEFIAEIVAAGGVYCPTVEHEPDEDGTILVEVLIPLVEAGVEDSPEAVAAALEDMGMTAEEVRDWEW